jgi:hypothetical protein
MESLEKSMQRLEALKTNQSDLEKISGFRFDRDYNKSMVEVDAPVI